MTRAVICSSGGDPFLALMQLKLFDRWKSEVDKFYICFNGQPEENIVHYVQEEFGKNPKCKFIYSKKPLGFGEPINKCLEECKEELIVLLEDDGEIYQSGVVDSMFRQIEDGRYDILGSPRFSCSNGIRDRMKEIYDLDYSGDGDGGPMWWPNFFFCKRSDLLRTDRWYAPKGWKKGDYIKEIDLTCQADECADTFGWTCMQLRALGVRALDVGQRHAMPTEIEDKATKNFNWKYGYFGWIHGGSLSSGWNGFLNGELSVPQPEGYGIQEFETRAAFWTIVAELDKSEELKEYKAEYMDGIDKFRIHYQLNHGRINNKIGIYKNLMEI